MGGIPGDLRAVVQSQSAEQGTANMVAEGARQEGNLGGRQLVVINQSTSLANAAEEAGFAAAEKVEKKLAERKAGTKESQRYSMTELAQRMVNMTGDSQAAKKLHEFVESMKQQGANVSEQQILQMVKEKFGDAAEQFTALEFLEAALEEEGATEESSILQNVKKAKQTMLKQAGPAIRAGINIAVDVLSFAKMGLAQIESLRELYGFAILGRATASEMYKAIMKRYGKKRFMEALEFLIQAAGNDLNAGGMGASLESAHLETAVNNVCFIQQLGNLFHDLEKLMKKISR